MGNLFTRAFGRFFLRLFGWRVSGELPNEKKLIVMVAPHTSNWDFVFAMLALCAAGVKWSYLMKKEAFFFPFKGLFMRLGGIPIDRSEAKGLIKKVADEFNQSDKLWLALTPEGTRSKVKEYKHGFLRMAKLAQVPVFIVAWNYPTKEIVLDRFWEMKGDISQDVVDIRDYINKNYSGKHPENQ